MGHINHIHFSIALLILLEALMFTDGRGGSMDNVQNSCQNVCVCKWKGGKQTAECIGKSLITIPDSIDPGTQVLDMSGNNLQILPRDTFIRASLLNLQKLYLRNCRLGQIDESAFKGLTNLVELDLSHNLLTSIPSTTLIQIPSLRELTLASNPIQKVESYAFKSTHSLTKLDLSHCDIQMIAPLAFEALGSLHSLKLNHNKLSELRPRTIETLSKLHGVELHDNPWMCDCRLRAAKIWLTANNIPYPVAPVCQGGPERVIDRTFAELQVDDFACRPEIVPVNRFIEAETGANASIICRTAAVPTAVVNWYWNGRLLVNGSAFSAYQKVFIYESGEFEKMSRLVLTNAQETDSGEFYCVAENRAGAAEANFTLHVTLQAAGMSSLNSGQLVGLTAALVILILFILLITLFLLVRLRRIPFSESKTPNHLEVITTTTTTTVSPTSNSNGKSMSTVVSTNEPITKQYDGRLQKHHHHQSGDMKLPNQVQKPPRLTDITYTTSHYDGNGSLIIAQGSCFVSPTASSDNNPDLINDTKRLGSGEFNNSQSDSVGNTTMPMANAATATSDCGDQMPARMDNNQRPNSGEYSRAGGCDSLYPSGLWETEHVTATATSKSSGGVSNMSATDLHIMSDLYLKRAASTALPLAADHSGAYNDRTPIIGNSHLMGIDSDYLSQTLPRANLIANANPCVGYPSDYGLPIVHGAEQPPLTKSRESLPQQHHQHHQQPHHPMPTNAKTIRVWQKGGVPVLPPVTALKRALISSRNSPDEGYQEGCGTDV